MCYKSIGEGDQRVDNKWENIEYHHMIEQHNSFFFGSGSSAPALLTTGLAGVAAGDATTMLFVMRAFVCSMALSACGRVGVWDADE
jgi:hypothetical protein